ncbi:MAG TPA: hypothetical protein VI542_21795 [Candidatus Tectomicrobia bacterium]
MAVDNLPERLLQTCVAYQRQVAMIHLDTPLGDTREARLAEAMVPVAEVCTPTTIEMLQRLRTEIPAAQQEAYQRLYAWALDMQVRSALLPMQREIQTRQRTAICLVDQEPIPLRASFAAMAAETRRDRRAAIEAAVGLQLREINALFEAQFKASSTLAEHLGYASLEALWTDTLPVAPASLADVATQILSSTAEVYRDLLTWAVRQRLRIPPGQLRRHDILALFTFPEYQAYYQPGTVVAGLQTCLREMGLTPGVDGRLEWRERSPHFGPPEALAIHIPDEIVLSYAPVWGLKGAEIFAGASGRALLWAYTSPNLPLFTRTLGDAALSESNAQWLAEILADPHWLAQYFGVSVDQNYAAWRCLDRLYRVRRSLGRFLYTRYLYTTNSLAGASEAYRDMMMDACYVDYPQEYYLLDWDWDYTSLTVLRGWGLTAALLGALHEQFAADWFRAPEAGEWLRQYWASAMGEPVEDLRDRCTGTAWDAELFSTALIRQDGAW